MLLVVVIQYTSPTTCSRIKVKYIRCVKARIDKQARTVAHHQYFLALLISV